MEAATWGFLGTLIGAITGAAASICTAILTSRSAMGLKREADALEREERARAFQRENLLQVQDALQNALRLMGRGYLEDLEEFKRKGTWGRGYLSEELDEETRVADRRMSALVERIADDSLRSDLKSVHQEMCKPLFANSESDARKLVDSAATSGQNVMAHLGEVLRSHY